MRKELDLLMIQLFDEIVQRIAMMESGLMTSWFKYTLKT